MTNSTPEQHAAIQATAAGRVRYILWLADVIGECAINSPPVVPREICLAAAEELRQLVGAQ